MVTTEDLLQEALAAAMEKDAGDIVVLDLAGICSFTDCFVICTSNSTRQKQAIADALEERLSRMGSYPLHVEGYAEGDWILMDYFHFVAHIFTGRAREFYDLERLWRAGRRREAHELIGRRSP